MTITLQVTADPDITAAKCWDAGDIEWEPDYVLVDVGTGDAGSESPVGDAVYVTYTGGRRDAQCEIPHSELPGSFSFESLTPLIAEVDAATGYVTALANGTAVIAVRGPRGGKRLDIPVKLTIGSPTTSFDRFASTSFSFHASAQILDRISGLTPSATTLDMFTNYQSNLTRNASCWANTIDLSPLVASYPGTDQPWKYGGTLITPRHVLMTGHAPRAVGNTVRFITTGGTVVDRTVSSVVNLKNGVAYLDYGLTAALDLSILVLNSDVTGITPAELMPADWLDYCPSIAQTSASYLGAGLPVLDWNQTKRAYAETIRDSQLLTRADITNYRRTPTYPGDGDAADWLLNPASGDSGCSIGAIAGNEFKLFSPYLYGAPGPSCNAIYAAVCDATVTDYEPVIYDITSYTNYG